MPYDDDEADLDEREDPEPDEDDDGDETVACPYCGAAVYEDAERCPRCENYLSREDAPSRVPLWVKLTALVCLAVAVGWAIRGC
jgi:uncharacterized paraquat-inducible protein A